MSIGPSLDDSDKDNIFILKNNLKGSAGNLQQLEKADSLKEKEYLEFYEKGQQVFY